jgi:hypothetical protein
VTLSSPPTATQAGVLVRHNASVEAINGRIFRREPKKRKNASRVVLSLRRRVSRTNGKSNTIPREPVYSTLEMDTHADTCVLGPNFVVLHYTCDVSPYTEVYESVKAVPIVSGATAWTDERTGLTYILVVNEALWMPDTVTSSLINPNQLRAYGITVQDNPFAGPMYISNEGEEDVVSISMFAVGTNISINTRTPTQEELDSCQHIILTSDTEWDPNDVKFPQVGAVHRDTSVNLESDQGEIYNVLGFSQRLIASCRVRFAAVVRDLTRPPTFQTEERRSESDARATGRSLDGRIRHRSTDTKTHDPTFPSICTVTTLPSI